MGLFRTLPTLCRAANLHVAGGQVCQFVSGKYILFIYIIWAQMGRSCLCVLMEVDILFSLFVEWSERLAG